jgi:rod shape-determining protein MreC
MENLMGRYRNVTILAAAIFIQILGLAIQVKRSTENESSRLIRVWAVTAVTPLEKGIVRLQTGTTDLWHNYFYLRGVRQENRQLREQIEQFQLEQVRLKQDADQARRLQSLLGFKEQFIAKTTAAQVIGSSGSEQSRTVFIDKGSRDGIEPSMAVISSQGVVGKVISVFKSTSQVLLINDQQSGVGAILEQSRLQGVLKGKASGETVIDKIMSEEDVKLGDRVLTSGGDQIFPKGLPLGTVAKVTKGTEFLQVIIKPAAELNHLEEVLVITKKEEREAPVSTATAVRAADILAQRLPSVPDKPQTESPAPDAAGGQTKAQSAGVIQPGAVAGSAPQPKPQAITNTTAVQPKLQLDAGGATKSTPAKPQVSTPGAAVTKPTVPTGQEPKPAAVKASVPPAPKPAANASQSPNSPPSDTSGDTPQ